MVPHTRTMLRPLLLQLPLPEHCLLAQHIKGELCDLTAPLGHALRQDRLRELGWFCYRKAAK